MPHYNFNPLQFNNDLLSFKNLSMATRLELKENEDKSEGWQDMLRENILLLTEQVLLDLKSDVPKEVLVHKLSLRWDDYEKLILAVSNMLEAAKRGESLGKIVNRYRNLRIINTKTDVPTPVPEKKETTKPETSTSDSVGKDDGSWLWNFIKGPCKKIGHRLISLICNCLGALPQFLEIEPIVGFAGLFPTFSFVVKGGSTTLYDLMEHFKSDE